MTTTYTARHRSMLLAVAQGRGALAATGDPDLTIDGRWCDHCATAELLADGLLRPCSGGPLGLLVPAVLTATGAEVLGTLVADQPKHREAALAAGVPVAGVTPLAAPAVVATLPVTAGAGRRDGARGAGHPEQRAAA